MHPPTARRTRWVIDFQNDVRPRHILRQAASHTFASVQKPQEALPYLGRLSIPTANPPIEAGGCYLWDRDEQIGPLASLIQGILRQQPAEKAHALAATPEHVDGAALANSSSRWRNIR
jgi:hypothetical protein